ncbi:MAG: hypothetical protein V2I66_14715 [Halieaceae bacterium]|jgi:hypothetical protein|nr:hypothetical protein [Halieaceae bacterium]
MLLSKVNSRPPRLPLPEQELRDAVKQGKVSDIVLRGVTPEGFIVECIYQPEGGLPVPAVMVTRAGTEKTIKCPDRALACLRRLGVEEFEVDVSRWDPGAAFNPTRESYLSRRRRQHYESTLARIEELLAHSQADAGVSAFGDNAQQRLQRLTGALLGSVADEYDLRALALCWCDANISRFPAPERAEKALLRYARSAGIDAPELEEQLGEYCSEEFKRRCKNQYLSSLDLGEAG